MHLNLYEQSIALDIASKLQDKSAEKIRRILFLSIEKLLEEERENADLNFLYTQDLMQINSDLRIWKEGE